MSHGTGVGLRGGRFTETFNFDKGVQRLVLHRLRFSEDVTVDGRVKVDVGKGTVTGRVSVTAPHGAGGTVSDRRSLVRLPERGRIDQRPRDVSAATALP